MIIVLIICGFSLLAWLAWLEDRASRERLAILADLAKRAKQPEWKVTTRKEKP